jgi:hypothetical protein
MLILDALMFALCVVALLVTSDRNTRIWQFNTAVWVFIAMMRNV